MSKHIKNWFNAEENPIRASQLHQISHELFFRDPNRPQIINNKFFFAPADGTCLYNKIVQPDEKVISVKGNKLTVQDILCDDEYDKESIVIDIFMSFYDVHINRIPYSGYLSWVDESPLQTYNMPMKPFETQLLEGEIDYNKMDYMFNNKRRINTIYNPVVDYEYYLVQTADDDINVTMHFKDGQNVYFQQNQRFSTIRWGSQVSLILPINDGLNLSIIDNEGMHVTAGEDVLVEITE